MAKYIQRGESIDYANASGSKISAGDVVSLTNRVGIAACDIANGAVGSLALDGVFEFDKTASLAISLGDAVYYSTSTKKITKTATDVPCGIAIAASASADTTVRVRLETFQVVTVSAE